MTGLDARALLAFWKAARDAGVELFAAPVLEKLTALPLRAAKGFPSLQELCAPKVSVLETLRALELSRRELDAGLCQTSLVATLPVPMAGVATTGGVARTLIRGSRRELLLVGYALSEPGLLELLVGRARNGVRVTLVGDRTDGGARQLFRQWPTGIEPLVALENVAPVTGPDGLMHGKVLVADRTQMLVGSANFTSGGMTRNLELGVRVEGAAAREVCELIEGLTGRGWLVKVTG